MRTVRPECPLALDEVVGGLVSIDPSGRPGSAAEALARIELARQQPSAGVDRVPKPGHRPTDREDISAVIASLIDPLWSAICHASGFEQHFVRFDDGEYLCHEGEASYCTFVLLRGQVNVQRGGELLRTEGCEGTFLGEVATLTGRRRTATLRAEGTVWACVLDAAELEQLVSCNPAVAIRLLKSLAERVSAESGKNGTSGK